MVQPGGPSIQRRSSSGLVMQSKTRRRGASKARTTTISRSVGAVISRVFSMLTVFILSPGGVVFFRPKDERARGYPTAASTIVAAAGHGQALLRLQLVQQVVQPLEVG